MLGGGDGADGNKKTTTKKGGATEPSAEAAAVPVTTAFIFTMPAAGNCEVGGFGWLVGGDAFNKLPLTPPATRLRQDGHGEDVSVVPGRSTFVMWAMGEVAGGDPIYHGPTDRGASEVDFLLPSREAWVRATTPVTPPEGSKPRKLRVALPRVAVPERRTTYMCI